MSDSMILTTTLKYSDDKVLASLESKPEIELTGLSDWKEKVLAWTPPHELVSSVEGCFLLTLLEVAKKMRVDIRSYSSSASATVVSHDGLHHDIAEIVIKPQVELVDESKRSRLEKLFATAEEYCVVARSLKVKVRIEL